MLRVWDCGCPMLNCCVLVLCIEVAHVLEDDEDKCPCLFSVSSGIDTVRTDAVIPTIT